ncbi:MAG: phosphate-binding protein [Acidobacteria bacterium]|nr:MAG: phosphate-binding protein [Acidobacteriota bacterium]PYV42029.1 MAG: phosphate-binding protein [Acidobacteriota bacterium]
MKSTVLMLALFVLCAAVAALNGQQRNITLKGSDTIVILGQRWAEVYMGKNPGVTIQVTGGGSGTGIAALINGTTDIAESSRPMKDKEKEEVKAKRGNEVLELPVAVDGLAVYVHESNPVSELTLQQIKAIYTGQIKNWKEVGGRDDRILLYSRENNSGTYAYFKEHVLENADFHPTAQTLPGTAAVINALAKDRRGIGYGGIAYGKGIKHLKVKRDASSPAVEPTMENVLTSKYPISRFLYWYFAGAPTGDLKALSLWVLSKEGQTVVEKVGYYPLSDRDRLASLAKLGLAKDRASVKQ